MDKVYQVFVSSTYADLADERRRVSETLAKAGYIPAGMELFPATDQQQLEFIKRVIDRCDYYVVVIGGRYGSLADEAISFTEKEYEYALERKIPVLAFIHGNPDAIPVGKTDQDNEKAKKLKDFCNRLASGRLIDYWTEPNELCTKVVIAVVQTANLTPGIGWIRGDQAIDPKVLQEAERLRIENDALKERLAKLEETEVRFPSELAGPNDFLEFHIVPWGDETPIASARMTVKDIFSEIFENTVLEVSEEMLFLDLAKHCLIMMNASDYDANNYYNVPAEERRRLRFHFEALGLIKAVGRTKSVETFNRMREESYIAWSLTEKGRRYMANLSAVLASES